MSNQRFESAPKFSVDAEPVVIQRAQGSTADLLVLKTHTGSTLASIGSNGAITTTAASSISDLTVGTSASLPSTTSIGSISSTELSYLDGVTSGIQTQINSKAALESPALSGTPTAPTATAGTNTTQLATTAFVRTEVSNLVASAPSALDTLNELATALGNDANFSTTVSNSLALKAPLASPTFTGTPSGPTAVAGTNTTQLATTEFVSTAVSAVLPSGMVVPFAGGTAPSGWLLCGGQEVAISTYTALYNVLGTTYGALTNGSGGAGSTHFRLPDIRGRVVAGEDDMTGSAANRLTTGGSGVNGAILGANGGVETVTLTSAQSGVPAHSHANTLSDPGHGHGVSDPTHNHQQRSSNMQITNGGNDGLGYNHFGGNYASNLYTNSSGTGISIVGNTTGVSINNVSNATANASSAHTNVQPTIILSYIIKV